MKLLFTVIVLASFGATFAQEDSIMQDAVNKPAMSLRCKELFKERTEKVRVQQKLNALLQRNQDLMKKSPNARETFHKRLKVNEIKVKNELLSATQAIERMEENIVRTGCPGLTL